jgi:hypothetical protein
LPSPRESKIGPPAVSVKTKSATAPPASQKGRRRFGSAGGISPAAPGAAAGAASSRRPIRHARATSSEARTASSGTATFTPIASPT